MTNHPPKQAPYPWILLLLEGLISVGTGLALLFLRAPTLELVRWLLGLYLAASGVLSLVTTLTPDGEGRRAWLAARGGIVLLAGFILLSDRFIPGVLLSDLALLLIAIMGVAIGFVGLIQAASGAGWGAAIMGILSLAFGYYVWRYSPAIFSYFITFLGAIVVIGGATTVVLAIRMGRRSGTENPIKVRHPLLGMLRVIALLLVMLAGLALALPAWLVPMKHNGMKLNFWVLSYTCRIANRTLRLDVECAERELLLAHTGIVFANHVSFLDISTLLSVEPMRFLSTAEVFRIPFIGWMADSITTIFVDRSSEKSRSIVREQISKRVTKDANPPFVIFPEGRFGTTISLKPYHRGAFEIAANNEISYLPCALQYDRPDIALWKGKKEESFIIAIWRVLTFRGRIRVKVIPMKTIYPKPDDDFTMLAADAQRATEAALGFKPASTTFVKDSLAS